MAFPQPTLLLATSALLGICISPSCGGTQASENHIAVKLPGGQIPQFDEQRAMEDLRYLCEEIGPRRIGTLGGEKTRQWLQTQLSTLDGWQVEEDSFLAEPPLGARRRGEVQGVNLLAKLPGNQAGEIWICSHYDTFDTPGFVGANDGGSSTVVLLELARQWQSQTPRQGQTLVLAWFDGEEKFPPLEWDDFTNSTFGSRSLAERMEKDGSIRNISALILLDMVGDSQLGVLKETTSNSRLKRIMEQAASVLDDPNLFVGQRDIKDDHIHFRRRNVPAINLIDFNYGPANSYWHNQKDNLDHVSAKSLGRIGRLILTALPAVEQSFQPRKPSKRN